jgi:hypothetical protein
VGVGHGKVGHVEVHDEPVAARATPATDRRGEVRPTRQPGAGRQHSGAGAIRPRVRRDPCGDAPRGSRARRACASAAGSRASWPGGGCSAERCACSRWCLPDGARRSRAAAVAVCSVVLGSCAGPLRGTQRCRRRDAPGVKGTQPLPGGPHHPRRGPHLRREAPRPHALGDPAVTLGSCRDRHAADTPGPDRPPTCAPCGGGPVVVSVRPSQFPSGGIGTALTRKHPVQRAVVGPPIPPA